jgi:hypothetical protein
MLEGAIYGIYRVDDVDHGLPYKVFTIPLTSDDVHFLPCNPTSMRRGQCLSKSYVYENRIIPASSC